MNSKSVVSAILAAGGLLLVSGAAQGAAFFSDLTGPDGTGLADTADWVQGVSMAGTSATFTNNQGVFAMDGSGWRHTSVRPEPAFDPTVTGGLDFESTLVGVTDSNLGPASYFTAYMMSLGSAGNWTQRAWDAGGERVIMWVETNPNGSTKFTLTIMNGGSGVVVETVSLPALNLYDGSKQIRLSLQLQDGGGQDLRAGYRILDTGTGVWGPWTYGSWHDPTAVAAPDAFAATWPATWKNSTYLYIEGWSPTGHDATATFDDVLVTPAPASLALLMLGGLFLLKRRKAC